jgi:hypothetical protein
MAKIKVKDTEITISNSNNADYISLTDSVALLKMAVDLLESGLQIKTHWNI